ncbi:hypothetical protein [Psychrobacter sp. SCQQ22]|nr:hypothetical protein [Psychrobacter sp. SCQQ22]
MHQWLVIVLLSVHGTHPTKIRVLVPMKGQLTAMTAQMEELKNL